MILVKIIIMVAIMAVIWRTTKAKEVHKVKTYYAYLLLHINFSLTSVLILELQNIFLICNIFFM